MNISRLLVRSGAAVLALAPLALALPVHADTLAPGSVLKGSGSSLYYYAQDGRRYVFPNSQTYFTWYSDFSNVLNVTDDVLAQIRIGGNVTYRPGVKLVKITTDPKVYAVDTNGSLRWVQTEAVATDLYGATWSANVDDIPDAFFVNYSSGRDIGSTIDFSPSDASNNSPTINEDKQLTNLQPQTPLTVTAPDANGLISLPGAPSAPTTANDTLVTYHGTVIDIQTKQPIPNVGVMAAYVGGIVPVTDLKGQFSYAIHTKDLQAKANKSAFQLYVYANNYRPSSIVTVPVSDASKTITFQLSAETPPLGGSLVYQPQSYSTSTDNEANPSVATITGHVYDGQTTNGLNDMSVVPYGGGLSSAQTDDQGAYTINVPTPGPVRLYLLRSNNTYAQNTFAEYNTYYQIYTYPGMTTNVDFNINEVKPSTAAGQ